MKFRKSVLSAAILLSLGATQVHAQDAKPPKEEASTLDTVQVKGIRGSLQRALEAKREANAIVDAITAEDVGKFPSTNVAEAMTIIPGVTIDKAFGQGEKISILGTDPALNRTLLNGQAIASADWVITDAPGRTFNYSLLAPQLVGKVEVFKSPEARIDEGSIGGTVIVHTRKPLELESGKVSGQVSYLYNDRVREKDPQASLMYNWKNAGNTFGFLVAAQRANENIRRDGVEAYGSVSAKDYRDGQGGGGSVNNLPPNWALPPNPDGSQPTLPATCVGACATTLENNLTARGPNSLSAHYFEQERKRDTYSVALQFRPSDSFEGEFNALRVKANYDNMSHSMFAFMGNAWNGLMKMTDVTIQDGIITKGTFDNALVVYDLINRQATLETGAYDLKLRWKGDRLSASAELGTSKATGGTGRQVFGEFLNWSDYTYDISGAPGQPGSVTFHGANPFTNPGAFQMDGGYGSDPALPTWNPGWGGNIVFKPTEDKERYGQLDFKLELDGPVSNLRFGYKQRRHVTSQEMGGVSLAAVAGYGNALASQFSPRPLPNNFLSGFSGVGDLNNRFTIDGWALADHILSNNWLAPWQTAPVPSTFADPSFAANTFEVGEDVKAAYVQADFQFDRLRGNVGLRYVQTESDSGSWACTVQGGAICPADKYAWNVVGKKYNNVLPNLNLIYDVNDQLVLRGSAAKVISRPNYGDMSSYLWLGDQTLTGGGGNPDIEPYESTNYDFSAEWYFSPDSILAGSVFYKDVGTYILQMTGPETHFNQARGTNTVFQVSRPRNAGGATIKGATLAFQHALSSGFGIVTNFTYADAESDVGRPLPFNSKTQVNVSPYFENDRWTARVTYSRRSKYFTSVDRGDDLWTRAYTSVDATLGYKINDNFTVSLDGMNLLDEAYHSYATLEGLTRGAYRTGRRYMATLRFQF